MNRPSRGLTMRNVPTSSSLVACRAPRPAWATTAPARPPTRAWLELEGMPKYQVIRFQRMAAKSAETTTAGTTYWESAMPLAMVMATAVPIRAPPKLRMPAIRMALRAESTPVETTVAMALAVSWKPLM